MNGTKLGFFAVIFLFGTTILVPVLLTDVASADCGAYVSDYQSCGQCAYVGDLLRCDGSAAGDYDRGAVRERDHRVSEYRCTLYGCAWIR
ncbi:MAG: hypothetical protein ABSC04_15865 [Syntrophobacteraceae bacterium]|jgi:hypothetical protein